MLLPVDEDGWSAKGLHFLAYPESGEAKGYRFLIPPTPGSPPAADVNIARDKAGVLLLGADGKPQLDLQTSRYQPHCALLRLLTA